MSPPRAFVMGHPIAHSRSPMLHGYWLKHYGIEGSYEPLDIAPGDLKAFFDRFRDAGWAGGNVTVPHKTAVIAYLDRLDEAARAMGAVNTLWWDKGALVGGNTDSFGFIGNIDELVPGWDVQAKSAIVLGAGGGRARPSTACGAADCMCPSAIVPLPGRRRSPAISARGSRPTGSTIWTP